MDSLFDSFYRDKKVLVTGHTGFKGSWLSIWLSELNAEVIGVSLDPHPKKCNFIAACLPDFMTDIRVDIQNYYELYSVFSKYRPEIVFHLAAQPLVRQSYADPVGTYNTNVMGTVHVLECIRHTETVKAAIIVTSDKCYENIEKEYAYSEKDPLGGYDPYSSSKGCAELVSSAYYRSFFLKNGIALATARAGNVIGGGDWAEDRLMTDCINGLLNAETINLRNPEAIRPWQHVFEPIYGYLLLARKLSEQPEEFSGSWNFGPEKESMVTVKTLVEKLIDIWGSGTYKELSMPGDPHEAALLMLDISKAKEKLGWYPALSITEALELTVEWYQCQNPDYGFDIDQIHRYLGIKG